jgi:acyl dehydratase|tara:strand:- start:517 stop:963 length:447 start_codon:yes stop_codon:yes gene_type:complete
MIVNIPKPKNLRIKDIRIGSKAQVKWEVKIKDIATFVRLSGDNNPLHTNRNFAIKKGFKDRVAHGLLLVSKISGILGTKLPGKNCLLIEENLAFPNPVYPNDKIVIKAKVNNINRVLNILTLKINGEKKEKNETINVLRGTVVCKLLS